VQDGFVQEELKGIVPRSSTLLRAIRSQPYLYSAMCKSLLFYSRHVAASTGRALYRRQKTLFSMSDSEARHCEELRNQGFTVLDDFFNEALMDRIYEKVDVLFRDLQIDFHDAYSVQNKKRVSLEGLTYQELESSEKMISLKDPLLKIPECVDIAFNETILKVITNFMGYIAPRFKPMVVRDFPSERPRESSNFHRDNDEADSVQFFAYLIDIDDTRGPLVYIPGTNRYDVKSCRPRLSRDLDINDDDGRISDREIEKYYPKNSWVTLRVKRGSVVIIHANGFHKGPSWSNYGDPRNKPRTALRFDLAGRKMGDRCTGHEIKIKREDHYRLSRFQRLFTQGCTIVDK